MEKCTSTYYQASEIVCIVFGSKLYGDSTWCTYSSSFMKALRFYIIPCFEIFVIPIHKWVGMCVCVFFCCNANGNCLQFDHDWNVGSAEYIEHTIDKTLKIIATTTTTISGTHSFWGQNKREKYSQDLNARTPLTKWAVFSIFKFFREKNEKL